MIKDFNALKIKLASPEEMLAWSFGEVTKAETINYRTFKAEPDGLMDERIFGPTKDYECFCGKYKKIRYKGIVCDRCGVEVTTKRVRRERMGHLKLVAPVTHVWFSHGMPNKLALLLNIPQKQLETVIYYARYLVTAVDDSKKDESKARVKDIRTEEAEKLEAEHLSKLEELKSDYEQKRKDLKKLERDESKLGVQSQGLDSDERKKTAHIKAAHKQRLESLEEKFDQLDTLISNIAVGFTLSEEEFTTLQMYGLQFFDADMGAPAVKTLLQEMDLGEEIKKLEEELSGTRSELKRSKLIQRKRLMGGMYKAGIKPEWIILDILPILPPDLRPIIQLPGGRFATSDLNDLYRRIINRNNRLKRLVELGAPQVILRNEKRMLQESVDALLDNNHRPGAATTNSRGMPYKSLSDMLRGKQGRFRQNLLGKRVDYSGRAVIIPGPTLRYDQCGLPKTIALELFKPFIMRELVARGFAANPARAKFIYEEKRPEVWDILEDVSKGRPVLLNRAPTLHKQSIVAFFPILIEGNAIQLHPLVCRGFNADFDGDQMAVHLPLSQKAIEEVKDRMLAPSNMLSMADGNPIMNTEKDMAAGIYFLTVMQGEVTEAKHAFSNIEEAISRYNLDEISLYEPVKVLMHGEIMVTTVGRIIMNEILPEGYPFVNRTLNKKEVQKLTADVFNKYGITEAIRVIDEIKNLGFKYAGRSGFSISMGDFEIGADPLVEETLSAFDQKAQQLTDDYNEGLITKPELHRLLREEWMEVADSLGNKVWELAQTKGGNLLSLNESGATPVSSWVKNISGVRGYVTDATGSIVDLPLVNNYKNGLNNFEYFVAARATRKSFADVALRTADSGYLTRRLVDMSQDVVVKEDDCGTDKGIYLSRATKRASSFSDRLKGRYLAEDLVDPATGEVMGKHNDPITVDLAKQIESAESIEKVKVRSTLTCDTRHGVCSKCYGYNFGTGKLIEVGEAVGVIAAQALGEPTTQLTLKSKSDARAGRGDVTQGLPRVEELFEIRTPRLKALIAEIAGKVKLIEAEDGIIIRISTTRKLRKTYDLVEGDEPAVSKSKKVKKGDLILVKADGEKVKAEYAGRVELVEGKLYLLVDKDIEVETKADSMNDLLIKDGDEVEMGQQLTYGSIDPKELALYTNIDKAQKYIINGVQDVYGIYGIPVDDKHLELVTSQMGRFCQIMDAGGSEDVLPGEFRDILDIEAENKTLVEAGKKQVSYERVLLGVTNAALRTESFLSAASFEQQVRVLTDAALVGKVDHLRGLKENVIIGRLLPIGQVLKDRLAGKEEVSRMLDMNVAGRAPEAFMDDFIN